MRYLLLIVLLATAPVYASTGHLIMTEGEKQVAVLSMVAVLQGQRADSEQITCAVKYINRMIEIYPQGITREDFANLLVIASENVERSCEVMLELFHLAGELPQ